MRGLSTLALRMDRHTATAAALAAWLEGRPGVVRVWHPALASHPQHEVATRQLARGGGMLAFELAGGRTRGEAFIDTLTIPERTASLGSVFTIVAHPPSTTHRQLDDAALAAAGITPGLLRVLGGARGPRRPGRRLRRRARRRGRGRGSAGDRLGLRRPGRLAATIRPDPRLTLRRTPRSPAP